MFSAIQKSLRAWRNQIFITVFKRTKYFSLPQDIYIVQFFPIHFFDIHVNISHSSMYMFSERSVIFWLPDQNSVCTFFSSTKAPCTSNLPLLVDFIRNTNFEGLVVHFLISSCYFALFGPNVVISTLFTDACSLCYFLNARNRALYANKLQEKLYISDFWLNIYFEEFLTSLFLYYIILKLYSEVITNTVIITSLLWQ